MFFFTHGNAFKEVIFLQKRNKAAVSIILALVFIVVMISAAVVGSSEFAILPAERIELVKDGEAENSRKRFGGRQRKQTNRSYYRLQPYHRKMLYR